MPDLIAACPEAVRFVEETRSDLESRYGERCDFHSGVMWTETPTAEGEVCGGEDPEPLVQFINTHGLLMLVDHDVTAPGGWCFRAALFGPPEAPVRFVAMVAGRYRPGAEMSFAEALGEQQPISIRATPPPAGRYIQVSAHHRELDIEALESLLADAPPSVERKVRREYRHSELISVEQLSVAVPLVLFVYPYTKKFAERLAEEHHEWWKVLERKVVAHFSGLKPMPIT